MESTSLKSRGGYEERGSNLFGKPPGLVAVLVGNAVVLVAAVVQGAVYYSMLPDELPAHFDWQGKVDAYRSKAFMVGLYLAAVILAQALFILLGHLLPSCSGGGAALQVPAREYWLNPAFPERQERAFAYLKFWLMGFGMAFGAYLVLFFGIVFHMAYTGDHSGFFWLFWPLTIAYLVLVAFGVYSLYSHFLNEPIKEALINYAEMGGSYETFSTPSRIYYQ